MNHQEQIAKLKEARLLLFQVEEDFPLESETRRQGYRARIQIAGFEDRLKTEEKQKQDSVENVSCNQHATDYKNPIKATV